MKEEDKDFIIKFFTTKEKVKKENIYLLEIEEYNKPFLSGDEHNVIHDIWYYFKDKLKENTTYIIDCSYKNKDKGANLFYIDNLRIKKGDE